MHRKTGFVIAALVAAGLLEACGSGAQPKTDELLVSAAISLKESFLEIARLYQARTGVRVTFHDGAPRLPAMQLEAGAPADVFASAGAKEMDELESKRLIRPATRPDFTRNRL